MADTQALTATKPKTAFTVQNATTKGPNVAYDFSQAFNAKEILQHAAYSTP